MFVYLQSYAFIFIYLHLFAFICIHMHSWWRREEPERRRCWGRYEEEMDKRWPIHKEDLMMRWRWVEEYMRRRWTGDEDELREEIWGDEEALRSRQRCEDMRLTWFIFRNWGFRTNTLTIILEMYRDPIKANIEKSIFKLSWSLSNHWNEISMFFSLSLCLSLSVLT